NSARPLILSIPSTRRTDLPMRPVSGSVSRTGRASSGVATDASCFQLGGQPHRVDDLDVTRAAAEVAVHRGADLLVGRVVVLVEQRPGGHEVAGGAEPALEA